MTVKVLLRVTFSSTGPGTGCQSSRSVVGSTGPPDAVGDDDASGHYQVGRGYLEQEGKPTEVSYFEPWNQQLFDPSEPFIKRVQWRDAYKSYRANLAHPAHNMGV